MEAKCSFCELFGEKTHCHNCKILNNSIEHAPQEITCSLEEFIEYIENTDDISECYGVGDYKTIELYTGEEVKMIILDLGRDKLASGSIAKVTLGILSIDGLFNMNPTNTNEGGWRESFMRQRMERIFKLLPPILQAHIKPVIKHTCVGQGNNVVVSTVDKLFLFSEVEIYGQVDYSCYGEDAQYDYFKLAGNRQFNRCKWLRSPLSDNSCFCYTENLAGASYGRANTGCGIAFGFCV